MALDVKTYNVDEMRREKEAMKLNSIVRACVCASRRVPQTFRRIGFVIFPPPYIPTLPTQQNYSNRDNHHQPLQKQRKWKSHHLNTYLTAWSRAIS